MNTVTVSGWLQADPVTEHFGDLAACELRLAVEWPGPDRRTGFVTVTCFSRLAVLAEERLAIRDHVGMTGWLRVQPADSDGRARQRVGVVAERLDFLGHHPEPALAPIPFS